MPSPPPQLLWDLSVAVPKGVPRAVSSKLPSPVAAAALELELAKGIRHLRGALDEQCKAAGVREGAPGLALERWRASAILEEEEHASKAPRHPCIPSRPCPRAETELARELVSAGVAAPAAERIASTTREAASKLAAAMSKLAHAAASGKALPPPPLTLTFHRHAVELASNKARVKVSRLRRAADSHHTSQSSPDHLAPPRLVRCPTPPTVSSPSCTGATPPRRRSPPSRPTTRRPPSYARSEPYMTLT
jgi:hypothetical protein